MEMNALSIKKLQNKELKIGNSHQEMLLLLMFMYQQVKEWVKNLNLEQLYTKEKWMFNIN